MFTRTSYTDIYTTVYSQSPLLAITMDPYAVLKVPPLASHEEVRAAYVALALKYHPGYPATVIISIVW